MLQQQALSPWADAREGAELGSVGPGQSEFPVIGDRETVRLVAHALEQLQRSGVARQAERDGATTNQRFVRRPLT